MKIVFTNQFNSKFTLNTLPDPTATPPLANYCCPFDNNFYQFGMTSYEIRINPFLNSQTKNSTKILISSLKIENF